MARVVFLRDGKVLKEVYLSKPILQIGRAADNDVVINDPQISERHCRLTSKGTVFYIEDLQSTNGVFLNGKRVNISVLRADDAVGLAGDTYMFVFHEEAAQAIAAAEAAMPSGPRRGVIHVIAGLVDGVSAHELSAASTKIGTSDEAPIKFKAEGLLSFPPKLAAAIHLRGDSYVIEALKNGYPKLNGKALSGQATLAKGDVIECGATMFRFDLR